MADEATISASLTIRKGDNQFRQQRTFRADVALFKGPSPGAITVTTDGVDVDLSQLSQPGLCVLTNLDATNYVEYGIREPDTSTFYPLGEILPGESYVVRLSRNLQEEYLGTGTSTSSPTNFLHLKANGASVNVDVSAFDS